MDTGQPTKEETILSMSKGILKRLAELQGRLDNQFSRNIKVEGQAEGRPQCPNVLDEILENLCRAEEHLVAMTCFISSDVLPKIN